MPNDGGKPPSQAKPRYSLATIRPKFKDAILVKSTAVMCVTNDLAVSEGEARTFIRKNLELLTEAQFVETVSMQQTGYQADVYGCTDADGDHWYVKLYADPTTGSVVVVSFHEPDHDLKCADGSRLKGAGRRR
jgi:hypothetical protein